MKALRMRSRNRQDTALAPLSAPEQSVLRALQGNDRSAFLEPGLQRLEEGSGIRASSMRAARFVSNAVRTVMPGRRADSVRRVAPFSDGHSILPPSAPNKGCATPRHVVKCDLRPAGHDKAACSSLNCAGRSLNSLMRLQDEQPVARDRSAVLDAERPASSKGSSRRSGVDSPSARSVLEPEDEFPMESAASHADHPAEGVRPNSAKSSSCSSAAASKSYVSALICSQEEDGPEDRTAEVAAGSTSVDERPEPSPVSSDSRLPTPNAPLDPKEEVLQKLRAEDGQSGCHGFSMAEKSMAEALLGAMEDSARERNAPPADAPVDATNCRRNLSAGRDAAASCSSTETPSTKRVKATKGMVKRQMQDLFAAERDRGTTPTSAAIASLRHCSQMTQSQFVVTCAQESAHDSTEVLSPETRIVMTC